MDKHWQEISPSEFSWEREALQFVRQRLPDHEPYRAWSNFEFIAPDGSIYEVDLLVLTPKGFYLVEIKSRPGNVEGDASTWTWSHDGKRFTDDNPLILANRKAKKLIGLLGSTRAMRKVRRPFLEACVFLSAEDVQVRLPGNVSSAVHTRDRELPGQAREAGGIVEALTRWPADNPPRLRIDRPIAKALTRAMEEIGVRPSNRAKRVGDYQLEALLYEGPNYQDWSASHVALSNESCRVRIYSVEPGASKELADSVTRAAKREYQILSGISHQGILKAKGYTEHERGPALIFEHLTDSQRLDHFMIDRGQLLNVGQRLDLLRQVGEALRFAHEKHLVHRALSPQNILVLDPQSDRVRIQIFNWQTGLRDSASTGAKRLGLTATSHIENFIEDESAVYMAPETLADRGEVDEQADVFSLGALTYYLFANQAPASNFVELTEKLREAKGLRISDVVDGAAESLQYLVQFATYPEVTGRLDTVSDLLDELDRFEDELTTPDPDQDIVLDPNQAKPSDRLEHGLTVKKRLGKGSTAVALLVDRGDKERVLKVALEPGHNEQLKAEGELLTKLRHQFIVRLQETLNFAGRTGLLLDKAGDTTLGQRLREDGRLQPELLERFGEDLLQTVDWLEQQGVPHRDIKPENLGVAPMGRDDALHLVLFDFSLARTPAENIHAGTVPYLDPFLTLRKPPRWDTHAERFAAAMTLYQMATGALPTWGDGQSDPAVLEFEVSLDVEAFEPALRDPMQEFFTKALRRNYRERFDNAQEMLKAWRKLFECAREPEVTTNHGEARIPVTALADATLETRLAELGLSTAALNASERAGLHSVQDLLAFSRSQLRRLRGIGRRTRRELANLMDSLATQFPASGGEPVEPTQTTSKSSVTDTGLPAVDTLARQLLPLSRGDNPERDLLHSFLGMDTRSADSAYWPSQADLVRARGTDPEALNSTLNRARQRWLRNAAITQIRDELPVLLDSQGGVMTTQEIGDALLASRGSDQTGPLREHQALAVLRAAVEVESARANPRWAVRRDTEGRYVLVARDEISAAGATVIDGQKLADYAEQLGIRADELAAQDPLPPPNRALEVLQLVVPPTGVTPLPANRLLTLATSTSKTAALSSRLELYPRCMDGARALRLALGAVAGARELTEAQIRERVAGRYPEAEPLPDKALLADLLNEVGSELRWDPEAAGGQGAFVAPLREFTTVHTATSVTRSTPVVPRFSEIPADETEARQFQKRLQLSLDSQQFLVLVTSPRDLHSAEQALARHFPVALKSFDELLIRHTQAVALELGVNWQVVLRADSVPAEQRADSRDWQNLLRVVARAMPRIEAELESGDSHTLMTHAGLLARYQQLAFIDRLREQTGRDGKGRGLWLLIASDAQGSQPTIDGHAVPVFTTAQWARIPESWLAQNVGSQADEPERSLM